MPGKQTMKFIKFEAFDSKFRFHRSKIFLENNRLIIRFFVEVKEHLFTISNSAILLCFKKKTNN